MTCDICLQNFDKIVFMEEDLDDNSILCSPDQGEPYENHYLCKGCLKIFGAQDIFDYIFTQIAFGGIGA